MKVAMLTPLGGTIPPQRYGGIERIVAELTAQLTRKGHEITLFTAGDSTIAANIVPVVPKHLMATNASNEEYQQAQLLALDMLEARLSEFDILHCNYDYVSLTPKRYAGIIERIPTLMTLHMPGKRTDMDKFLGFKGNELAFFSSISLAQQNTYPGGLNFIGNIYNAVTAQDFPYSSRPDKPHYLVFIGRLDRDKSPHLAIKAAKLAGYPLKLIARLDASEQEYFRELIEPELNEEIEYLGELPARDRNEVLKGALALLHPVMVADSCPLAVIEAMACGVPVIAFPNGALPEMLVNGKHGYLVNSVTEMSEKIGLAEKIERKACRAQVIEKFNIQRKVNQYLQLYNKVIELFRANSATSPYISTSIVETSPI